MNMDKFGIIYLITQTVVECEHGEGDAAYL